MEISHCAATVRKKVLCAFGGSRRLRLVDRDRAVTSSGVRYLSYDALSASLRDVREEVVLGFSF